MKPIDFIIPILCAIPLIGCTQVPKKSHQTKNPSNEMTNVEPQNLDSCVIAGGCFWCMDAVYRRMKMFQKFTVLILDIQYLKKYRLKMLINLNILIVNMNIFMEILD